MTPSKYQLAFYDAIKSSSDNLVVDAVAGSGKSTSVEHSLAYLPNNPKTAIFAFNKSIVESMRKRIATTEVKIPDQVEVNTLNAFGWSICRKATKINQVQADKDDEILKTFCEKGQFWKYRNAVTRVINLLKANCYFEENLPESMIQEYLDNYGIDFQTNDQFFRIVQDCWSVSSKIDYILNFADQIYMPLKKGWKVPQFEVGYVDELQDLNPAQQEIMLQACSRFIGVGDRRQAIYAFAGADAHSLQNMIERTKSRLLPLSISYRCAKNIVKLAQKIVPHIEYSETAEDGIVDNAKNLDAASDGDFVLCRTNAPLVKACLQMIREGRRAQVKGREIGDQLISLINRMNLGPGASSQELFDAIGQYQIEEGARLNRANREQLIEALEDRCETIRVLVESSPTVTGVKDKIKGIFSEDVVGIMFSSMHKSKGLEAKRVFILEKKDGFKREMTPTQAEQEQNLRYVAITRAMLELYFVKV